jgi:carboxymethylenebutenolidase
MGDRIKLTTSDGFALNAYRAEPTGKAKGGIVLLQEVWGLNNWIRNEVDRYAREGYVCVAPATMDRIEYGFESENYGPDHFGRVGQMMKSFDPAKALIDIEAAVRSVADAGKAGVTGYCFGGALTWRSAHAGLGLTAGSGYYGGGIANYIDIAPTIPLEMHYAENDTGIPLDLVEALRARYPRVSIYLYPAGHGFCNADRSVYDATSAAKANSRTLAFFEQHLS